LGFLRGNFLLKLAFTFDFITQSKLLGGWGKSLSLKLN